MPVRPASAATNAGGARRRAAAGDHRPAGGHGARQRVGVGGRRLDCARLRVELAVPGRPPAEQPIALHHEHRRPAGLAAWPRERVEHLAERTGVVERLHPVEQAAGTGGERLGGEQAGRVGIAQRRRVDLGLLAQAVDFERPRSESARAASRVESASWRAAASADSAAWRRSTSAVAWLRRERRLLVVEPARNSASTARRAAATASSRARADSSRIEASVTDSSASSLPRASSMAAANDWRIRSSSDMARPDIRGKFRTRARSVRSPASAAPGALVGVLFTGYIGRTSPRHYRDVPRPGQEITGNPVRTSAVRGGIARSPAGRPRGATIGSRDGVAVELSGPRRIHLGGDLASTGVQNRGMHAEPH